MKTDEQILRDLEKGDLAYELSTTKGWQLVREAMDRIVASANKELLKVDPSDTMRIVQLQQIIKLYSKDFIPALIENWKAIGEFAFNEAKDRGVINTQSMGD